MLFARPLAALALAAALAPVAANAQMVQPLTVNGGWLEFAVDDLTSPTYGTEWIDSTTAQTLSFSFTLAGPATLRVVDAGFAGDTFGVRINGNEFFTSAVPATDYDSATDVGNDFDAAWADGGANFSRLSVTLQAGTYTVEGWLAQSVSLAGSPLNATVGAISLVPEPATVATLLAGLLMLGAVVRRQDKR